MAEKFVGSAGLNKLITLIKDNYTDNTALATALSAKQNVLTFDSAPNASSNNPVTSGGVKTALDALSASLSELIQYITVFPEQTVTTDSSSGSWYQKVLDEGGFEPDLDETYRFTVDGSVYELQFEETSGTWIYFAGNEAAKTSSSPSSNTPPFGVFLNTIDEGETWDMLFSFLTSGEHSVKIQKSRSSGASGANFSFYPCNSETEVLNGVPNVSSPDGSHIYLVANSGSNPNIYDEFIYVFNGTNYVYEKIGTTDVDLSGYATTSAMNTALSAKQDTLTVDNTPMQSSNNPVKSGGVYASLAEKADVRYSTLINTSVTTDGTSGIWYTKDVPGEGVELDTSKTYKVTIDGTVYDTQFSYSEATGLILYIDNNQDDFSIIMRSYDEGDTWDANYQFKTDGTHTVKIEETDEYVAKSDLAELTANEVQSAWDAVFNAGA